MFRSSTQSNVPPTSSRRYRSEAGFTVVEVALAAFVMTFGIASALVAMQAGFKTLDVARGTTLASQLLQSEMENLRLQSWSDLQAQSGTTEVDLDALLAGQPEAQRVATGFDFTLTRTIEDLAGREGDMVQIVLQATWRTMNGRELQRTFRTYYTRNGLYDYYYTLARP